jgi:hypothetical protein
LERFGKTGNVRELVPRRILSFGPNVLTSGWSKGNEDLFLQKNPMKRNIAKKSRFAKCVGKGA